MQAASVASFYNNSQGTNPVLNLYIPPHGQAADILRRSLSSPSDRFVPLLRVGWDNGFDGALLNHTIGFAEALDRFIHSYCATLASKLAEARAQGAKIDDTTIQVALRWKTIASLLRYCCGT